MGRCLIGLHDRRRRYCLPRPSVGDSQKDGRDCWNILPLCNCGSNSMTHICIICYAQFRRFGKSRRQTCSRSCACALAWFTRPEERIAGITASKLRPDQLAKTAAHNKRRWSDPLEHEKMTAQNREQWADIRAAKRRARNIKRAWSPEKRAEQAALWTPERKAAQAERARLRWAQGGFCRTTLTTEA